MIDDPIDPDPPIPGATGATGATGGGGGGSVSISAMTITVPYGSSTYTATVTNASVLSTSKLMVTHGAYTDLDVNDPDLDQIEYHVETIAAGSFLFELSARSGTIGGPFKFNYLIG
jgi:hypothetical protein